MPEARNKPSTCDAKGWGSELKPKHIGGYTNQHVILCEQTLVTLLHKMGPWKRSVFLVGGLVPRYLFPNAPYAGTTDVDLVVSLELMAETEAYHTLEKNLKAMGFDRSVEDGRPIHWRWRNPITEKITVLVELLCDDKRVLPGSTVSLPGERRLSALNIEGASLAMEDYEEIDLRADLFAGGGVAIETVRVARLAAFLVLKAKAYADRGEEKDAYDLVQCLMLAGAEKAANQFHDLKDRSAQQTLFSDAEKALHDDFASDLETEGYLKNGPISYARFLTDPGAPDQNIRRQRDASGVVEAFLAALTILENSGSI